MEAIADNTIDTQNPPYGKKQLVPIFNTEHGANHIKRISYMESILENEALSTKQIEDKKALNHKP